MEEPNNFKEVIDEFFYNAKKMYGDDFETFWFYEKQICPCCRKRKIDTFNMGNDSAMSLNAYIYRDLKVLIGYLLCSRCITELIGDEKVQERLYNQIEQNLKKAFHKHLETLAS